MLGMHLSCLVRTVLLFGGPFSYLHPPPALPSSPVSHTHFLYDQSELRTYSQIYSVSLFSIPFPAILKWVTAVDNFNLKFYVAVIHKYWYTCVTVSDMLLLAIKFLTILENV